MRKYFLWVAVVLLVLLMISGAILLMEGLPGNMVRSTIGPLEVEAVTARRSSPVNIQVVDQTATIRLGDHTVVVKPSQVELPGGRVVAVPATCKRIELKETSSGIIVLLDGVRSD